MIQSSVAQTPTERGVGAGSNNQTLGEVQLQFQQSQGRNEVVAKNYRRAWKEAGQLFYELLDANSSGTIKLYKKGSDGKYQPKEVSATDWQNQEGYECKVLLKEEQDKNNDFDLKKLAYVKNSFINNPVAQKLAHRKELELLGWTPEEIDEVMKFEEQVMAPQQQVLPPGEEGAVDETGQQVPIEVPVNEQANNQQMQ